MNRRDFLGNSGKKLAVVGLAGLASGKLASGMLNPEPAAKLSAVAEGPMITRTLGKTGINLPIVSMGVMNADNPALVKAAWNAGIRHFDTAWIYQNGNNERMIGKVLKEIGAKREEYTIASKIVLWSMQGAVKGKDAKDLFLNRVDESLSRLQLDYLDILYYHDVRIPDQVNDPYIQEAFTELVDKKKIRFKGFSTHSDWPELVNDAAKRKFYDVILLSYNYSMFSDDRVPVAIKTAYDAGIGLIAMKTQCQQGWYKNQISGEMQAFYSEKNMNSALLKWVLRNEYLTTAVPGFTTFDQLKDDMSVAYNLDFSDDEKEFLNNKGVKLAMRSVCRQCSACVESCPQNADIPTLMRSHMYSVGYGNALMAKITLGQIEKGRGIDICAGCSECSATCKNSVPLRERISELREIYC
jgi:uncharacterized protein